MNKADNHNLSRKSASTNLCRILPTGHYFLQGVPYVFNIRITADMVKSVKEKGETRKNFNGKGSIYSEKRRKGGQL